MPLAEPGEEVHHPAQAGPLGRYAQGLAVLLPIRPEPALIAFEDRPGDLVGLEQAAFLGPRKKRFQLEVPAFDGLRRTVADAQGFKMFVHQRGQRGAVPGKAIGGLLVAAALVLGAAAHPVHCVVSGFHGHGVPSSAVQRFRGLRFNGW